MSDPAELLDEAALEARQRLTEEKEEWANADGEGGDGGEAVTISRLEVDRSMSKRRKADERAMQKLWNQSRSAEGGKSFGPSRESGRKNDDNRTTEQKKTTAAKPSGYIPPHLRGLSKPVQSESKSRQSSAPAPLSQQMQKRLVIMDDDEYGM